MQAIQVQAVRFQDSVARSLESERYSTRNLGPRLLLEQDVRPYTAVGGNLTSMLEFKFNDIGRRLNNRLTVVGIITAIRKGYRNERDK